MALYESIHRKRNVQVEAEEFHPDKMGEPFFDQFEIIPHKNDRDYLITLRDGAFLLRPGDYVKKETSEKGVVSIAVLAPDYFNSAYKKIT